jgi:hypothetical protein
MSELPKTRFEGPITPSAILASRWTPAVIAAPLSALILVLVGGRFANVDFLSELTVYRIGDAISLLFGESSNVQPVQGLPGALIAKVLTWLLLAFGQTPLITPGSMTFYIISFFGLMLAVIAATVIAAWPILTSVQRCALALLLLCPWLLGGPSLSLMIEPDYWITEWAYLVISFCLIASRPPPAMIGVWLAIGLGIKVTLLGIAPLFLLALPDRKSLATVALSFALAYLLMALAYMGSLTGAAHLLMFQSKFFAHPSASAQYPDIFAALSGKPFLICLTMATGLAIVTSPARVIERCWAVVWPFGFVYLIWRRPHDTSLASAATAFLFMALYFVRRWPALIAVAIILLAGATADRFERLSGLRSILQNAGKPISDAEFPDLFGMIFLPDNEWNAGLAVQAIGYNGGLGFYYPLKVNLNGLPTYASGGRAFQALFPRTVIIAANASSLAAAEAGLKTGIPLWWTRPEQPRSPEMQRRMKLIGDVVERSGAHVQTQQIKISNEPWLFQRATK